MVRGVGFRDFSQINARILRDLQLGRSHALHHSGKVHIWVGSSHYLRNLPVVTGKVGGVRTMAAGMGIVQVTVP